MTGDCTDKRYQAMLHHYELGMLADDERQAFEMHLMVCQSCLEQVQQFKQVSRMMKTDLDIRQTIGDIAGFGAEAAPVKRVPKVKAEHRPIKWSPILKTSLAIAAVLVLLLLKPWQLEFRSSDEAIASENRLAVMPFENMVDPDDSTGLGQIAANLLVADLSESHYVQVLSTQRVKDIIKLLELEGADGADAELTFRVAERARVKWVLTGSILQVEPELVLSTQLIEIPGGVTKATQMVMGDAGENVFALVDKLTVEVKNDLALPADALQETDPVVADVTTESAEAYLHYLDGVEKYNMYFRREAAESFGKAVGYDSTFAMAYYYLAQLRDPAMLDKALQYADQASRKEQRYIRSLKASAENRLEDAIEELKTLVKEFPDEKLAYYKLGLYQFRTFNQEDAIEYYRKAIEIDPLYKVAYNQLAHCYDELGDLENAILAINDYIALVPDEPNPYNTRGTIYSHNGKLDEALASYEKALEIKPDFVNARWNLGFTYLYQLDYERAQSWFEDLASTGSEQSRSQARFYLGLIPIAHGQFEKALEVYEDYIALDVASGNKSGESLKRFQVVRILIEQGRLDQAREEFEKYLVSYTPLRVPASRQYQAQMLAELGDYDRAEEMAGALKDDFEHTDYGLAPYQYAKGAIDFAGGNPEQSLASFEEATRATTDFPVHFMLGRAYVESGRLSDAVRKFEEQLDTYTIWRVCWSIWNVKMHYYLGVAYEDSRWNDQAVEQYEMFLGLWKDADPGIAEVEDARRRLDRLRAGS